MPRLPMTFACGLYDRMLALYTKEVQPEGIDLNFIALDNPREIFDRMLLNQEFDASEMSSSDHIRALANGDRTFVALPVFPSRVFRHGHIAVNRRFVAKPQDLAGKRIGVPLYGMTAAVFIRGMLAHDHDVDLSQVEWVEGGLNDGRPYGLANPPKLARPVTITSNRTGKSLSELLAAGEIQATIGPALPDCCDRHPDVTRLFPDYRAREQDYYRRTKIFPIMHLVVIRREFYAQHPFIATSLFRAFCASKELGLARMRYTGTLRYMLPWLAAEVEEVDRIFDGDPWPYGVTENQETLNALVRYLVEQGLIAHPLPIEDLFVPTFGLHPEPA